MVEGAEVVGGGRAELGVVEGAGLGVVEGAGLGGGGRGWVRRW